MADISIPIDGGIFDSTAVVETVNGFPRGDKAVDSAFFAKMMSSFYGNGILKNSEYGDGGFAVAPAGGLTVKVSPGIAWIRGYMAWLHEEQSFALSSGQSVSIVLRLNTASGQFSLVMTPYSDSLPTSSELICDLVLAEIDVGSGLTTISWGMIADTRPIAAKCGFVTSAIDALSTVPYAVNAGCVGGIPLDGLVAKSGAVMTGRLTAAADPTGAAAVRNISYGKTLPESLPDGDIFILLTE